MEKINSSYNGPWIAVSERMPEPEVFVLCWDGKETFVEWFGSKPDAGRGVSHWMPYPMPPGATSDMHDGRRAFAALSHPAPVAAPAPASEAVEVARLRAIINDDRQAVADALRGYKGAPQQADDIKRLIERATPSTGDSVDAPVHQLASGANLEIDGHKGEEAIRRYVRTMARTQVLNQWLADVYCNALREIFTRDAFSSSNGIDEREAEFRANNKIGDLWRKRKNDLAHFWPDSYGAEYEETFPSEHCKVTESLIASLHKDAPVQQAGDEDDDIVARLLGRAKYIRDQGGVKSAEVMESAASEIKNLRGEA